MDLDFNKNEDHNKLLVSELKKRLAKIKLGGGKTRIAKQHEKGKMTARERVAYLLDDDAKSIEIGVIRIYFKQDAFFINIGVLPFDNYS